MDSESLPRTNGTLPEEDRRLLRSLSGVGILKLNELAGDPDLGMDEAEVKARLERLVDLGYVKCYFTTTVAGSAALRRTSDLSVQKS